MSSKNCDFYKNCEKLEKSQFLLKFIIIKSSGAGGRRVSRKNCNFSKNCEKLEKSQFLLDTLVPPVTLDLIHHKLEARLYCSHQETPFPW